MSVEKREAVFRLGSALEPRSRSGTARLWFVRASHRTENINASSCEATTGVDETQKV